ncbi:MAG: nitrilase-related carbon-nitrogen hydrolase [bacterium]|nr:nitrilase-related carbon-nitrogen hydrolase [bacterium]
MWLPVLSAVLGIVAFLPMNFYPAAFVFLIPLFIFFIREEKLWRLILGAALFRVIFGLGTVYYSLEPFFWLSSLFIFLGLPLSVWIIKKSSARLHLTPCTLTMLSLPFIWTLFDLLEAQYSLMPTYVFSAGNALGSSPFLGLATIGGFVALTFFVALINVLITAFFLTWVFHTQVKWALSAAIVVLVFAGWGISNLELRQNAVVYAALPNSLSLAVVSTSDTFTADSFPELVQELANKKIDFVVFPENMFDQSAPSDGVVFKETAKKLGTPIIAAYDTLQNTKKYNSAVLFDAEGSIAGIHNKNRLTFIGEYWPFGDWQPSFYKWLREKDPSIGDYALFDQKNADTPGERNLLSATFGKNTVLFAALICLEIHYPSDLQEYRANGARFIVNPSSNRWISEGLGLGHFIYLSTNVKKIESVSLQLPIISSAADDFAGVILPSGETHLLPYQTDEKNYSIFVGEIRY